jgi:hypothetical protein
MTWLGRYLARLNDRPTASASATRSFEALSPTMTLTWYALPSSVRVAPAPGPAKHSNTLRRTVTSVFRGQRPGFCPRAPESLSLFQPNTTTTAPVDPRWYLAISQRDGFGFGSTPAVPTTSNVVGSVIGPGSAALTRCQPEGTTNLTPPAEMILPVLPATAVEANTSATTSIAAKRIVQEHTNRKAHRVHS